MIFKYQVDASVPEMAGRASTEFKTALKQLGVSPKVIRRISIAMYEGEINMVIHANGGEITCEVDESKIQVEMADSGPGIPDLDLAMTAGWSTASPEARELGFGAGMGMPNMKKFSDDMKVETEVGVGTTLTLGFNLT
ncbi:MAG: anti-sigma regulatory factor [Lachnospiraceae bacterium]|jgi:serine/threonine-protein kinase RsbT|nr:anti-sigma regulatory factor [Lachnospiraceae bacterium]